MRVNLRKGNGRRVVADEEIDEIDEVKDVDIDDEDTDDVSVESSAEGLLFEVQDVAQVIAEITGQDVEVSTDDETDEVEFAVGDEVYTITPDGDEEEVVSSRQISKRPIRASRARRGARRRPVKASSARRAVRRIRK